MRKRKAIRIQPAPPSQKGVALLASSVSSVSFASFASFAPSASPRSQKGVALLAVLWLAVALSVMALTTAFLVRTEVEAVSNEVESQRSYYLARGGIEAAIESILRSPARLAANPDGPFSDEDFRPGQRWLRFEFPGGFCVVEVVPEEAKLNVNRAPAAQLAALFLTLGVSPADSLDLAEAIADWRSLRPSDLPSNFDLFYSGLEQPYRARHRPLEQLEELLPVRGMNRDLFFGRIEPNAEGQWQKRPPLADLLTATNSLGWVNLNYAAPEVLRVLPGWTEALVADLIAARTRSPFRSWDELQSAVPGIASAAVLSPVGIAAGTTYTLTATGGVADSRVRRSVRTLVRIESALPFYHRVLGWWDDWPLARNFGS